MADYLGGGDNTTRKVLTKGMVLHAGDKIDFSDADTDEKKKLVIDTLKEYNIIFDNGKIHSEFDNNGHRTNLNLTLFGTTISGVFYYEEGSSEVHGLNPPEIAWSFDSTCTDDGYLSNSNYNNVPRIYVISNNSSSSNDYVNNYLVADNKKYQCKSTHNLSPYLVVNSTNYLDLTTNTNINELKLKIKDIYYKPIQSTTTTIKTEKTTSITAGYKGYITSNNTTSTTAYSGGTTWQTSEWYGNTAVKTQSSINGKTTYTVSGSNNTTGILQYFTTFYYYNTASRNSDINMLITFLPEDLLKTGKTQSISGTLSAVTYSITTRSSLNTETFRTTSIHINSRESKVIISIVSDHNILKNSWTYNNNNFKVTTNNSSYLLIDMTASDHYQFFNQSFTLKQTDKDKINVSMKMSLTSTTNYTRCTAFQFWAFEIGTYETKDKVTKWIGTWKYHTATKTAKKNIKTTISTTSSITNSKLSSTSFLTEISSSSFSTSTTTEI